MVVSYIPPNPAFAWREIAPEETELLLWGFVRPVENQRSTATVFHAHEVMRLVLATLPNGNNEQGIHSTSIISRFGEKCLFADVVFDGWWEIITQFDASAGQEGNAVNINRSVGGGATQNILREMFGVNITNNNRWKPCTDLRLIGPIRDDQDEDYYVIDDIRPTCEWIRLVGEENLLVLPNSGLRLSRICPEGAEISTLDDLLGVDKRFQSYQEWLSWLISRLEAGDGDWVPSDEIENKYYFTYSGSKDEEMRYHHKNTLRDGPDNTEWWSNENQLNDVPKVLINDTPYLFGASFEYLPPEERRYGRNWSVKQFHVLNTDSDMIWRINVSTLNLFIPEDDNTRRGNMRERKHSVLMKQIRHMTYRALQILYAERGFGRLPNFDESIAGLGIEGSKIASPYSEFFLIQPSQRGAFHESPIYANVLRRTLEMNWWGFQE